jgi:mxaD protein
MSYSYRRVDENFLALPVSSYTATISVEPAKDGKTTVEWIGHFYRGDTGNEPPPNLNDGAAEKAMTTFFVADLNNLKKLAEHEK